MTERNDVTDSSNERPEFPRRSFLGTASALGLGALGAGSASGSASADQSSSSDDCDNPEGPWRDYDHSGDSLGECDPLESVHTRTATIEEFDLPATHIVFKHDDTWYAMQTDTQDIVFQGSDGGEVVNRSLDEGRSVRVVPNGSGRTHITTSTTIDHTSGEKGLVLEKGTVLDYKGDGAAVDLSGNGLLFEFDIISSAGKYCIRDRGTGTSYVNGYQLRGASDTLWFTDAENFTFSGFANSYTNIRWLHCGFADTPYGIRLTDAKGRGSEGHRWDIGTVFGPAKKGIVIGEADNPHDTHSFNLFYAEVDPLGGGATSTERLVEINDNQNGVVLEGFTPALGGEWEVEIAGSSRDSRVTTVGSNHFLRVKRESMDFVDQTKTDPISHETFEVDLIPDSLGFYKTEASGSGSVEPSDEGMVVQSTGGTAGSVAAISRKVPHDFGNSSFTNQAAIQTNLKATSNAGQEAWAVWGDPDGQSVGWYVEDDTLYGYASDGDGSATTVLEEGFPTGAEWNLTAFYNPPTDVHFFVRAPQDDFSSASAFTEPPRDGINVWQWPTPLASLDQNVPSGSADAKTAMSIRLENTETTDKQLQWSIWRNHQYPVSGKYNSFKQLL